MIALLSLISGFVSPYIGSIIGYFQSKQDNAHELAMQIESNNAVRDTTFMQGQASMAEFDVKDSVSARKAQPSYGIKLLDALDASGGWLVHLVKPILVAAFTIVEVANGFMRPYTVYIVVNLWAAVKIGTFWLALSSSGTEFALDIDTANAIAKALIAVWDEHDWIVFDYVLGFLFGSRHKMKEAAKR